jgi:hypothetical protein
VLLLLEHDRLIVAAGGCGTRVRWPPKPSPQVFPSLKMVERRLPLPRADAGGGMKAKKSHDT